MVSQPRDTLADMGNPHNSQPRGPCSTCNANGGRWPGEEKQGSVHCLRPGDSGRHVIRGIERERRVCWRPAAQPMRPSALRRP